MVWFLKNRIFNRPNRPLRPKRRRRSEDYTTDFDADSFPARINVYDTPIEHIVTGLLERAAEAAKSVEVGESFTVSMTDDEVYQVSVKADIDPIYFLGPIMFRAEDYNLQPGVVINGKFEFTRLA